jgi:trimeric autotransporter adhesin
MKNQTPLTNSIDPVRNSRNRLPNACWTRAFPLIPLALAFAWLALAPQAWAVCQEGCLTPQSTALGEDALVNNVGTSNTAIGFNALFSNTGGTFNTAVGEFALRDNTDGTSNTAIGTGALDGNTTGSQNTATGEAALINNTTGFNNTANGFAALNFNTTGVNNTAIGITALASTTGNNNIGLGAGVGSQLTSGNNNIYIGNPGGNTGLTAESGTIRIGTKDTHRNTLIAGISGATVPNGVAVIVDGKGHLGTTTSSARFKEAIKPMDKASEAILALKPVTFHYKHELDPEGIAQFGLVAEDVERVNPTLVARDEQGKPYTVRYEAVNAMLLNEFLKARRQIDAQQKQIDALTAGLQEVKTHVETRRVSRQTVVSSR